MKIQNNDLRIAVGRIVESLDSFKIEISQCLSDLERDLEELTIAVDLVKDATKLSEEDKKMIADEEKGITF